MCSDYSKLVQLFQPDFRCVAVLYKTVAMRRKLQPQIYSVTTDYAALRRQAEQDAAKKREDYVAFRSVVIIMTTVRSRCDIVYIVVTRARCNGRCGNAAVDKHAPAP